MNTEAEKLYKEWCGEDRHLNDCHPVHDSSEVIEFAEYCLKAQSLKGEEPKYMKDFTKAIIDAIKAGKTEFEFEGEMHPLHKLNLAPRKG